MCHVLLVLFFLQEDDPVGVCSLLGIGYAPAVGSLRENLVVDQNKLGDQSCFPESPRD